MLASEIENPSGDAAFMVVGEVNHLVLRDRYPAEQHWLPLGNVFMFIAEPEPVSRNIEAEHKQGMVRVNKKRAKPFASNPDYNRSPDDPNQIAMAFPGHTRVTHNQWDRLDRVKHQGWERHKGGQLIFVEFKDWRESTAQWLSDNCDFWFYISTTQRRVYFYNSIDAVNFKLVHG